MKSTRLYIIRHGETEWNLKRIIQGHADSPLTDSGRAQAMAIATRLQGLEFNTLYSSDLGRAVSTAQYISDKCGHPIFTDERLRELNYGVFEGLNEAEAARRFPKEFKFLKNRDPEYIIPGGESYNQFSARAISCLEELMDKHKGEQIMVITHGGILSRLFRHALNLPVVGPYNFRISNAALNAFFFANRRWQLEIWGDISHLSKVKVTSA